MTIAEIFDRLYVEFYRCGLAFVAGALLVSLFGSWVAAVVVLALGALFVALSIADLVLAGLGLI